MAIDIARLETVTEQLTNKAVELRGMLSTIEMELNVPFPKAVDQMSVGELIRMANFILEVRKA